MEFSDIVARASKFATDNSPAILTAVGVVGTLATAYLTGTATIKAVKLVEMEEAARGYDCEKDEHLTKTELVKVAWKCYIPAVGAAAIGITAVIAANRVSGRRATSVATALAISERAFSEYKAKVVEKLGEGKDRVVRDSVAQDHVNANPPEERVVILTDGGHVLCRDEYSGRYFKSSMEEIRRAENDINRRIVHDGYASLTEFYELIGLPRTSHSDELGWTTDDLVDIKFSGALTKEDKPCMCFTFEAAPFPAFYKNR